MKSLLSFTLSLVIFTCAMRYWQYDFGFARMTAAYLLAFLFDFIAIIYIFEAKVPRAPKGFPSKFILFQVIFLAMALVSVVLVDWELDGAPDQYYKNILFHLALTSFIILATISIAELKAIGSGRLLKVYIATATFSAIWCLLEVILATYGVGLNEITFGLISTYKEEMSFLYEWDFFYRATGFAGVNAQATYLVSVIPIIFVWHPFRIKSVNASALIACLAGLALTMSKNGFVSLFATLFFLAFFRPKLLGTRASRLIIAVVPLGLVGSFFWDDIVLLFLTRVNVEDAGVSNVLSGRSEIFLATLRAIFDRPLGYGIGQYVVHIMHTDTIDIGNLVRLFGTTSEEIKIAYSNPHNNWLTWMFEYGVLGGGIYIFFYGWLIRSMLRMNTELSGAVAASIFGLVVGGIFNSTLDQFSVDVFIVTASMSAYCEAFERYYPQQTGVTRQIPLNRPNSSYLPNQSGALLVNKSAGQR